MIERQHVRAFVIFVLIATAAFVATYLLVNQPASEPVVVVTSTTTPSVTATFLSSPTPSTTPTPLPVPTLPTTPTALPDMPTLGRRASRSLVLVTVLDRQGSLIGGSGSIVDSQRGLILTNWHVVTGEGEEPIDPEGVGVSVTVDPDKPPEFVYWARVLTEYADPEGDLALLQITHLADGTPIEGPLHLQAVPLGDSSQIRRGDPILLLGFPDYAKDTVSMTDGIIATWDEEWIKSTAAGSYGLSGGMLLNRRGQLIGVHTGQVPVGIEGELSLARPINMAIPLIEQASDALGPLPSGQGSAAETQVVLGIPALSLHDAPTLDSQVTSQLPSGTEVEVLEAAESDGARYWSQVRVVADGNTGWVEESYLASREVLETPILFTSDRAGSADLYKMFADGSGMVQLTRDLGDEEGATWSPDRSYIAFSSNRNGSFNLYTMDVQGGSWIPLTRGDADDVEPAWSPDGGRIAFASDRDGSWAIYELSLESGTVQRITFGKNQDRAPAWSPDGTRLVFSSRRGGTTDLFLLDLLTGQEMRLTANPHSDGMPAWSPAQDEIVYAMVIDQGARSLLREIAVLDPFDSSDPQRLTDTRPGHGVHGQPDWSPDGQWIVFASQQEGNAEIHLVPASGGLITNLSDTPGASESDPAWTR